MNRKKQLQHLIDNYANDVYINQCLGLSFETIAKARQGIFGPEFDEPVKKKKLVPVTRQFPEIPVSMRDTERIVVLTKHGLSARKIQPYLTYPLGEGAIARYASKRLGPARKGSVSREHRIPNATMPYVLEALDRIGKDRFTCEICLEPVPGGCIVHHTKYEGATIYDLMFLCTSCNLSRENKGLS